MPVILATQEAEIRRIEFRGQLGQEKPRSCLRSTQHKNGLAELLKWERAYKAKMRP
jgi:hypothetical protein